MLFDNIAYLIHLFVLNTKEQGGVSFFQESAGGGKLGYEILFSFSSLMSKGASSLCTIAKSIFIGYSFRRTSAAQVLFFLV